MLQSHKPQRMSSEEGKVSPGAYSSPSGKRQSLSFVESMNEYMFRRKLVEAKARRGSVKVACCPPLLCTSPRARYSDSLRCAPRFA